MNENLSKLISYRNRYEITIQLWPEMTTVFIYKDGVELKSYGGDFDFAINSSVEYLERINPKSK